MVTGGVVQDHPYRELERAGWQRAAHAKSAAEVLDVACGAGLVSALARSRGAEVIGIDFSPDMLAVARRRHPSLDFREGDAEALPFEDGRFDAVLINFGLHHFPFPRAP